MLRPSNRARTALFLLSFLALLPLPALAQGPVGSDVFSTNSCQTPDRDNRQCGPVRWGWGDCPGSHRQACDWCYGKNGVFAYVKRTNRSYKLSSACEQLAQLPPGDVFWSTSDPDVADRMESAGGSCTPERGGYICQDVDPQAYRQNRRPTRGGGGDRGPQQQRDTGDLPAGTPCTHTGGTGDSGVPGYDAIPIYRLTLLDSAEFRANPGKFARGFEALTNGTFFGAPGPGAPVEPVGPMVIGLRQRLRKDGKPSGFTGPGRGGIAVFSGRDRDVVQVVRQPGRSLAEIQRAFPGVRDFMGGGALLIERGRSVGTQDLLSRQAFANTSRTGDPPRGTNQGLHAAQMNSAFHTLVGVRGNEAYVLIPKGQKTGSQIQRDLCEQGFEDLVMFDGGHGFVYYRDGARQPGTYSNLPGLTGLGINPR